MRPVRRKLARHKVKFGLPDVSHKKTQFKILKMIIIELLLVVQILVKNAESHNHQLSFIIREMSVKNHNKISRVTSEKWSVQKNVSHVINTRERTILKKNGSPDICLLILLYNKPLSTLHDGKRRAHFVYSIFDLCLCSDNQVCAGDTVCVLITVFVQW